MTHERACSASSDDAATPQRACQTSDQTSRRRATDVGFWSLHVGRGNDLIADLADIVATPAETVTPSHELEIED